MKKYQWHQLNTQTSRNYTCGYCDSSLASEKGYQATDGQTHQVTGHIYICHLCEKPTFFNLLDNTQTPSKRYGDDVSDIDDESVKTLYNEARDCVSINAFTASILSCRKLLMHVAVAKGAKVDQKFIEYVEYLSNKGYVPPDAKSWVDHIRKKGNEANHEILIMSEEDANDLIKFAEMLLKLVYEFPAATKKYNNTGAQDLQK